MSKKCPKCGYHTDDDSAKFCNICGQALEYEADKSDFEYDFGACTQTDGNTGINGAFVQPDISGVFEEEPMYVATTIDSNKANQLKKNVYSWSIFLIVISILRFLSTFLAIDDVNEIKEYLPLYSVYDGEIFSALNLYVNVFYVEIAVLLIFIALAIALVVFSVKMNKKVFPVLDDKIFDESKKAFIISLVTLIVVVVYIILEIVIISDMFKLSKLLDGVMSDVAITVGSFVGDVLILAGSVICMINSLQLSKCKKQ